MSLPIKGKNILHPSETKIWILLSISALAVVSIFFDMFRRGTVAFGSAAYEVASSPYVKNTDSIKPTSSLAPALQQIPYLHVIGLLVFAVLIGSCLAYLYFSRKKVLKNI